MLCIAAAAVLATIVVVSPLLRPDESNHHDLLKDAERHLDKVTVSGFRQVGDIVSGEYSMTRFWIGRTDPYETVSAIKYDGRPLNQDLPGAGPSPSRYQERLGWLVVDNESPCGLGVYRVIKVQPAFGPKLSDEDKRSVADGTATLISVAVTCGGG